MAVSIKTISLVLTICLMATIATAQRSFTETPKASDNVQEEMLVSTPSPINIDEVQFAIQYPDAAQDAGVEGTVVCKILVDAEGNYMKHRIVSAPDSRLRDAIDPHIARLRFVPAKKNGKAVAIWTTLTFNFSLIDGHTAPAVSNPLQVREWKKSAKADMKTKQYTKALHLYEQALAISSDNQKPTLLKGAILAAMSAGNYAQARVHVVSAQYLATGPVQQADMFVIKALSFMLEENTEQAVYWLEKSQYTAPGYFPELGAIQPYLPLNDAQLHSAVTSLRSLESSAVGYYLALRLEEL